VAQAGLILLTIAVAFAAFGLPETDRQAVFVVAGILGAVVIALSLWLFVLLGFLKGTPGPNAYGPDPLPTRPTDAKLQA